MNFKMEKKMLNSPHSFLEKCHNKYGFCVQYVYMHFVHMQTVLKFKHIEPHYEKNLSSGFATRVDSNWPAQPQKLARLLKFQI